MRQAFLRDCVCPLCLVIGIRVEDCSLFVSPITWDWEHVFYVLSANFVEGCNKAGKCFFLHVFPLWWVRSDITGRLSIAWLDALHRGLLNQKIQVDKNKIRGFQTTRLPLKEEWGCLWIVLLFSPQTHETIWGFVCEIASLIYQFFTEKQIE